MKFDSYKAMIYFVTATIYFYKNKVRFTNNPNEFFNLNLQVLSEVKKEGLKYFNYEISYNQMMTGITAYIQNEINLNANKG